MAMINRILADRPVRAKLSLYRSPRRALAMINRTGQRSPTALPRWTDRAHGPERRTGFDVCEWTMPVEIDRTSLYGRPAQVPADRSRRRRAGGQAPSMPFPTPVDGEQVACWSCTHDVDDHDVRARCLHPACTCGWEQVHHVLPAG